jgi:hypothetical protein
MTNGVRMPVFRGPALTACFASLWVLLINAWLESRFGGSIYHAPAPGQLWNHGRVIDVSMRVWKLMSIVWTAQTVAFAVFMGSMAVMFAGNMSQGRWYLKSASWKWPTLVLVAWIILSALAALIAATLGAMHRG